MVCVGTLKVSETGLMSCYECLGTEISLADTWKNVTDLLIRSTAEKLYIGL